MGQKEKTNPSQFLVSTHKNLYILAKNKLVWCQKGHVQDVSPPGWGSVDSSTEFIGGHKLKN